MQKRWFFKNILFAVFLLFSLSIVSSLMLEIGAPKKTLVSGERWYLGGGYSLVVNSIDARSNPRQAWLALAKDFNVLEDAVTLQGTSFNYSDGDLVFYTDLDSIFAGATTDMVQFKNSKISFSVLGSEVAPGMTRVLSDTITGKKTLASGEKWDISGGYSLVVNSIDTRSNPRQAWFTITKDCQYVADFLLKQGTNHNDNTIAFSLDSIFAGATTDMVQLKNVAVGAGYEVAPVTVKSESWSCGEWGTCINGNQTRTCTDANSCGTTLTRPSINQGCVLSCTENWQCGSWSACINGNQSRTCNDANSCGTTSTRPSIIRECGLACNENWRCGLWSACINGNQTRTCNDANSCGTTSTRPLIMQKCGLGCTENWQCGSWSACINGNQTRTCNDANSCGTTSTRPAIIQICSLFGTSNASKSDVILSFGKENIPSALKIFSNNSKIYTITSKNIQEIKIVPEAAVSLGRLYRINNLTIIEYNGRGVYYMKGQVKARLFFVYPVTIKVVKIVDMETGKASIVIKPWWAFLATGI